MMKLQLSVCMFVLLVLMCQSDRAFSPLVISRTKIEGNEIAIMKMKKVSVELFVVSSLQLFFAAQVLTRNAVL